MDQKYFYVNSSIDNKLYEINVDEIDILAKFATTLDPINKDNISESQSYINALIYHSETNNMPEWFKPLYYDMFGIMFLEKSINLCLIEKEIREKGIQNNDKLVNTYNNILREYKKLLNHSSVMKNSNHLYK